MKRLLTILILLCTAGMIFWGLTRTDRVKRREAQLLQRTSDSREIRRTVKILGDDWLGYLVLRSPEFQQALAENGIRAKFEMEPDFSKRLAALADGSADFAALTVDSYLMNGSQQRWPGVTIFTIDESFGGDAIIGSVRVANLDALNTDSIRGAFVGNSPSEFLLRSEVTHFRLDRLRPRLNSMRVNDIDQAYSKLARGDVDFAVLWEPQTSKALREIKGTTRLIDTQHARGIIVDVCVASRRIIADEPDLAETVTRAYFRALHGFINDAAAFQEAAARDSKRKPDEANAMLAGIRFTSLDENAGDWLAQGKNVTPQLASVVESVEKILGDHQIPVSLPNGDPLSIIYRPLVQKVAASRGDIPALNSRRSVQSALYRPLTDAEWAELARKVRGTLLDRPITFAPGSTEIPEDFQDELREAVPRLRHYPSYRVIVEAHVSDSGQADLDQALSEERALAVKRFLMWECGVPDERIQSIGKGATQPLPRLPDERQSAYDRRNRRARIILVGD